MDPNILRKGDVFLYRGSSIVSWAIRFFDGTEVNHAGLYLGDSRVGEALSQGLAISDLAKSVEDANVWVRRLKSDPPDMQPVLDVAHGYLAQHNRYGYEQIILLVFLALTRKLKFTPILRTLLRALLDKGASVLTKIMGLGMEPMICSEFVYRCYQEADPRDFDTYTLLVPGYSFTQTAKRFTAGRFAPGGTGLGTGIHPESILAMLDAPSARSWFTPKYAAPEMGPRPEPPDEEIGMLLAQYKKEIENPEAPVPFPALEAIVGPSFGEIGASVQSFAARLHTAVHPQEEFAITPTPDEAFLTLWKVSEDFVTPGDLFKCDSLYTVGVYPEV